MAAAAPLSEPQATPALKAVSDLELRPPPPPSFRPFGPICLNVRIALSCRSSCANQ